MATIAPASDSRTWVSRAEADALLDDDTRRELIAGELFESVPSGRRHSKVGLRFGGGVERFATDHDLGEVFGADIGVVFRESPMLLLGQDAAFVRKERLPEGDDTWFLRVVPDMVIEVVSPSDTRREVAAKVALYLELGVSLVWVADPALRTVTIYRRGRDPLIVEGDDAVDGEDVLPGFRMPLPDLFR